MRWLKPYLVHRDGRGEFCGITQHAWAEVNFIETRAGEVRGNHYHTSIDELFFIVSGEIEVTVQRLDGGARACFRATKGDIFVVEPFEVHTFRTITDAQWVNMLSHGLDPDDPDLHRPGAGE